MSLPVAARSRRERERATRAGAPPVPPAAVLEPGADVAGGSGAGAGAGGGGAGLVAAGGASGVVVTGGVAGSAGAATPPVCSGGPGAPLSVVLSLSSWTG